MSLANRVLIVALALMTVLVASPAVPTVAASDYCDPDGLCFDPEGPVELARCLYQQIVKRQPCAV